MADLLPDIPADLWNAWSADQFGQAAQEKIASLSSDIAQGVQSAFSTASPPEPPSALAPPEPEPPPPPTPAVAAPPSLPEAAPVPAPAPPPPAPAATDTLPAPTDTTAAPSPLPEPTPAPAETAPSPSPSPPAPVAAPPPSTPQPSSNWDIGGLLGAAESAGADVSQFAQSLNQGMQSGGANMIGAALGAAEAAGANMGQFASQLGSLVPQAPQAVAQAASGLQGPTSSTPGDLIDRARQAAASAGIDPEIFTRQIQQESGFNPNAQSGAGALGVAQFMPDTAKGLGINPLDPIQSLTAAAKLDAQNLQRYGGDWGKALAAYNAGGGNVDKYGGIPPFEETQRYVSNILGGAKDVVQNAASAGAQAINSAGQAAQSAVARTSQFAMGLSSGDAMAFCGPAAAMAFADTFGRNPTVQEARQLAQQVGWSPDQGMAGPSSEVSLLKALGIDTHMTTGVNWQQVAQDASSGNPVIIDTPGHYFYVDGYNPDTGQFHFGTSATDLKASGGKEWFTPDQLGSLGMGAARAAIFADHPLSPGGIASAVGNTIGGAVSGATQKAQDTLNAVLDAGMSTVQDTLGSGRDLISETAQNAQDALNTTLSNVQSRLPSGEDLSSTAQDVGNLVLNQLGLTPDVRTFAGTALDVLNQQNQRNAPMDMLDQFGQNVEAARQGDWGAFLGGSLGLANQFTSETNPFGTPSADISPAVSAGLTAAGIDPTLARVLGMGANLAAFPAVEAGAPRLVGAAERYAPELAAGTEALLRSRMAAEAEVNAALGGLPGLFGVGEGQAAAEAGNWSRVAGPPGIGPLEGPRFGPGGTPVTTGASMLQRALDALSNYPEDIAGPIRQFAASAEGAPSEIASTIMRWAQDNPLEAMPGLTAEAERLVQQAGVRGVPDVIDSTLQRVASENGVRITPGMSAGDVIDELRQAAEPAAVRRIGDQAVANLSKGLRGGGPYLPAGEMPGQLGLLPDIEVQRLLEEGTGGAGVPAAGLTADQQAWLQRAQQAAAQRDFGGLQSALKEAGLYGSRVGEQPGVLPGFESNFQRALPEGIGEGGVPTAERAAPVVEAGQSLLSRILGAPGAAVSRIGRTIASAASPTQNIENAVARNAIEDWAAIAGRNSTAADVAAETAVRSGALPADQQTTMRNGLVRQATNKMIDILERQGLAKPVGEAPKGWEIVTSTPGSTLSRYAFHPDVVRPINAVARGNTMPGNDLWSGIQKVWGTSKSTIFSLSNFHTLTEGLNAAWSSPQTLANYVKAFGSKNFAEGFRTSAGALFDRAAKDGVTGLFKSAAPDVGDQVASQLRARLTSSAVSGVGGGAAGYAQAKLAGKSDEEAWQQAMGFGAAGVVAGGAPIFRGSTASEALNSALWERAVPIAKVTAYDGLVQGAYKQAIKAGKSEAEALAQARDYGKVAAQIVNERFGGLNYAMMGRSPTLQNAARLTMMAPDWLESTIRQTGRMVGGPGAGEARGYLGRNLGTMIAVTEMLNHFTTGHWTDQNQPGHQFEIEVKDPAGGYMHLGVMPGNYQSLLNEASKVVTDTGAKRNQDLANFLINREAAPVSLANRLIAAQTARNTLQQPYGYDKAGLASILQDVGPIGLTQVAQGINAGNVNPMEALAMAIIGLNPRYTNPTTTAGTEAASSTARGPITVAPVPMQAQKSEPIKVQPIKER